MYAAVFPVPFLALAMRLFLDWIIGIDYYWIGVGTVYPFYVNPSKIYYFRFSCLNDWYFVGFIS